MPVYQAHVLIVVQAGNDGVVEIQLPAGPPHVALITLMHLLKELNERVSQQGATVLQNKVMLRIAIQVSAMPLHHSGTPCIFQPN